ncbi:tyrosine phosphatase [Candidatus Scalindua japonica]|uniref:protein-tyrosine-phosphatase n=1 Tax=Candidatus Scalindua japonica TaxID=1284222 RepID=A0A286U0J5_9BACT|nr:CpsB/CapC family capsule biosynthesis tyrosine phosphatase [Candidatus Scalindua japonica]GAX61655.1 tyrosine phosphatase [Candidatus Scalindua japonica]
MIDIHAHILPSIDDGPETIEGSIALCKVAEEDGIKTIVATPHTKDGVYEAKSREILKAVETLNHRLKENQIDVEILPGAEIHIHEGLLENIKNKDALTINNGGKFILFELPFVFIPPGTDKFIFNLKVNGIVPILAHAERIKGFQKNPKLLEQLVAIGARVQVNAHGLTKRASSRERKCIEWLLKNKLVHFIASDTHSLKGRPPILSEAVKCASRIVGEIEARKLVYHNPQQIINGIDIN